MLTLSRALVVVVIAAVMVVARAGPLEDVGYSQLQARVANLATGSNTMPMLNEASTADSDLPPVYHPNPGDAEYSGTAFIDATGLFDGSQSSSHATGMARRLIGNVSSMTPGVASVLVYEVNDWINSVLLDSTLPERLRRLGNPITGLAPVANHSWVATISDPATTLEVLHRIDWLVDVDNMINVVGVSGNNPIASNAYNVVAVRHTGRSELIDTANLSDLYVEGRAIPQLVAPLPNASNATALISSAAVLLVDSIYPEKAPAELIKAVLLAGADRVVEQNSDESSILDYRASSQFQATNGMDRRYGAGQLNIDRSYEIFSAPAIASSEDGGGLLNGAGSHYDASFGGSSGSNRTASYRIETRHNSIQLTASLVWNAFIDNEATPFQASPSLVDLDLVLYDITDGAQVEYLSSQSTVDNTENIWVELPPYKVFELRVETKEQELFSRDYALAWHIYPDSRSLNVPVLGSPIALVVLLLGLLGIGVTGFALRN